MNSTAKDDGAAEDGIIGRWKRFDREGRVIGETVIMKRSAWLAIDPAGRPDGSYDVTGCLILFECHAGWVAHLT